VSRSSINLMVCKMIPAVVPLADKIDAILEVVMVVAPDRCIQSPAQNATQRPRFPSNLLKAARSIVVIATPIKERPSVKMI
jgi:hypothetical protein